MRRSHGMLPKASICRRRGRSNSQNRHEVYGSCVVTDRRSLYDAVMTTLRKLATIFCCLAVCGCSQGASRSLFEPPSAQSVLASGTTSSFELLHSFANKPDGALAIGSLTDVNGTFYGTTACGGVYEKPVCKKAGSG